MKLKQLLFILTLFLSTANLIAADIYVSAGGNDTTGDGSQGNPYATINKAFSEAANNDVIKIVGTITTTTSTTISTVDNKSITIEGTDATATVTGFSGASRILIINTAYTGSVTLRNLIFLNNTTSNNFGGPVLLNNQSNASVIIENCTFTGNSATTDHASNGGGAIAMLNGTLTITNSNFSANTTIGQSGGGAIYIAGTTNSTITGTTFYNNTTTNLGANLGRGGAINFNNSTNVTPLINTITNCTFFENKVAQTGNFHGAAIRVNSNFTSTNVSVSNSLFYNNKSQSGAGVNSDFNGPANPTMNITNSLAQFQLNADSTTGSTITNSDYLVNSSLTWNGTLNKVTFTAPSLLTDATPIDFGSDFSDVGSFDSKINLFKGTTNSDWATGTNWSSTAIPTSLENVTLLSDSPALVIGGSTTSTINNLSVHASSSLTINSGGSLIVNGTSTGNVTYNRQLTFVSGNDKGWHLVASPVAGQVYNNTYANTNSLATSGTKRGLSWYNTTGNSWSYLEDNDSNAGTFTSGIGYSLKRSATGTVAITGTINTSDVNGVGVSTAGNGYNLVGNPYTSYMSSQTFLTANANLNSQIWTWSDATGYTARIAASNFILAPGQGFFVQATSGSTVNFAETNQSSGTDNFQKSASNNPEINLFINNNEITRGAQLLYFDNNVTTGFDNGYEGELFGGVSHTLAIYSDLVSDSNGKKYQVQSLPIADMETIIVPVGIIAAAGKEITFTAEAMNLPSDLKVFLEDRVANTMTRLDEANTSYKVTLNEDANGAGRFYVHTKASGVLSTADIALENISVFATNNGTLRIVGLPSGKSNLKLYNILGKQVMQTSFTSTGAQEISLPKLSTGVYLVQLESEAGKLNKKIVLE